MPIPEANEVDPETYEKLGPPPPPRGTLAYRKLLLSALAQRDSAGYVDAARIIHVHNGWRGAVDLMIEMLNFVGTYAPEGLVDAYGRVLLAGQYSVVDEEEALRHATELAPRLYPEDPPHVALRKTLESGEVVWHLPNELLPVWEEAATALRRDGYHDGYNAARVALTRWLNTHRDKRVMMGLAAASVTHGCWRHTMPVGDEWIAELLDDGPDLGGSLAWSRQAEPEDVERATPGVMGGILAAGEREYNRRRRRKGKRCSCCGRRKQGS